MRDNAGERFVVMVTDERGVEMQCVSDGIPRSFDTYDDAATHRATMQAQAARFGRDVAYRIKREVVPEEAQALARDVA